MGLYNYASKINKIAEATSTTSGGVQRMAVADDTTQDILSNVLIELKKLNLHLSIVNGETIKDVEVE